MITGGSLVTDPRIFFSAVAATTGALVAIVGGLLVSRLVALSSERNGLTRRRGELTARLAALDAEHRDLDDVRYAWVRRNFRTFHLRELLELRGEVSPEELTDRTPPLGAQYGEPERLARELVAMVQKAFAAIESAYAGETPPSSSEELRRGGVAIGDDEEEVFEAVAEQVVEERRPSNPLYMLPPSLVSREARTTRDVARQDATLESLRVIDAQSGSIGGQLALLDEEIRDIGRPRFLWLALLALGYFALGGAAFPLAFLAFDPLDNRIGLRQIVFFVFLSGLAALFAYITVAICELRRRFEQKPAGSS